MYTLTQLAQLISETAKLAECPAPTSYHGQIERRIAALKLQLYLNEYRELTGKEYVQAARPEIPLSLVWSKDRK